MSSLLSPYENPRYSSIFKTSGPVPLPTTETEGFPIFSTYRIWLTRHVLYIAGGDPNGENILLLSINRRLINTVLSVGYEQDGFVFSNFEEVHNYVIDLCKVYQNPLENTYTEIYGLLGIIQMQRYYLHIVTKKNVAANILGKVIFSIEETNYICINTHDQYTWVKNAQGETVRYLIDKDVESQYLDFLKENSLKNDCYFSHFYDVTNNIQTSMTYANKINNIHAVLQSRGNNNNDQDDGEKNDQDEKQSCETDPPKIPFTNIPYQSDELNLNRFTPVEFNPLFTWNQHLAKTFISNFPSAQTSIHHFSTHIHITPAPTSSSSSSSSSSKSHSSKSHSSKDKSTSKITQDHLPLSDTTQLPPPLQQKHIQISLLGPYSPTRWISPVIQGYISQTSFIYNKHCYLQTIIARRAIGYAGTRFIRRGICHTGSFTGSVANEVESELIMTSIPVRHLPQLPPPSAIQPQMVNDIALVNQAQGVAYSQMLLVASTLYRGSIPLLWSQTGDFSLSPEIQVAALNETTLLPGESHFRDLLSRYHGRVHVISLIKQNESKKKREGLLGDAYGAAVRHINKRFCDDSGQFIKSQLIGDLQKLGQKNLLHLEKNLQIELQPGELTTNKDNVNVENETISKTDSSQSLTLIADRSTSDMNSSSENFGQNNTLFQTNQSFIFHPNSPNSLPQSDLPISQPLQTTHTQLCDSSNINMLDAHTQTWYIHETPLQNIKKFSDLYLLNPISCPCSTSISLTSQIKVIDDDIYHIPTSVDPQIVPNPSQQSIGSKSSEKVQNKNKTITSTVQQQLSKLDFANPSNNLKLIWKGIHHIGCPFTYESERTNLFSPLLTNRAATAQDNPNVKLENPDINSYMGRAIAYHTYDFLYQNKKGKNPIAALDPLAKAIIDETGVFGAVFSNGNVIRNSLSGKSCDNNKHVAAIHPQLVSSLQYSSLSASSQPEIQRITQGSDIDPNSQQDCEKKTVLYNPAQYSIFCLQQGISRWNCVDSCDRTNAAQYVMGKAIVRKQLETLWQLQQLMENENGQNNDQNNDQNPIEHQNQDIISANNELTSTISIPQPSTPFDELPTCFTQILQPVFTEHGNNISRRYTGTDAMHKELLFVKESTTRGVIANPLYLPRLATNLDPTIPFNSGSGGNDNRQGSSNDPGSDVGAHNHAVSVVFQTPNKKEKDSKKNKDNIERNNDHNDNDSHILKQPNVIGHIIPASNYIFPQTLMQVNSQTLTATKQQQFKKVQESKVNDFQHNQQNNTPQPDPFPSITSNTSTTLTIQSSKSTAGSKDIDLPISSKRLEHIPLIINQHHNSNSINIDRYLIVLYTTSPSLTKWLNHSPQEYIDHLKNLQQSYEQDLSKQIKKQRDRAERAYLQQLQQHFQPQSHQDPLATPRSYPAGQSSLMSSDPSAVQSNLSLQRNNKFEPNYDKHAKMFPSSSPVPPPQSPPSSSSSHHTAFQLQFVADYDKVVYRPTPALDVNRQYYAGVKIELGGSSIFDPQDDTLPPQKDFISPLTLDTTISFPVEPRQLDSGQSTPKIQPSQSKYAFDTGGFGSSQQNQFSPNNSSKDVKKLDQKLDKSQKKDKEGKGGFFSSIKSSWFSSSDGKSSKSTQIESQNDANTNATTMYGNNNNNNNNNTNSNFQEYNGTGDSSDSEDEWSGNTTPIDNHNNNNNQPDNDRSTHSSEKQKKEKSGLTAFEKFNGLLTNGLTAAKRYYLNNVTDAKTQRSINLYLGFFIPFFNSQAPLEIGFSPDAPQPAPLTREERKLRRAVHIWDLPPEALYTDMDLKWSLTTTKFIIPFSGPKLYNFPTQIMEFLYNKNPINSQTALSMVALHGVHSLLHVNKLTLWVKKITAESIKQDKLDKLDKIGPENDTPSSTPQTPVLKSPLSPLLSVTDPNDPFSLLYASSSMTPRSRREIKFDALGDNSTNMTSYTHNPLSPSFNAAHQSQQHWEVVTLPMLDSFEEQDNGKNKSEKGKKGTQKNDKSGSSRCCGDDEELDIFSTLHQTGNPPIGVSNHNPANTGVPLNQITRLSTSSHASDTDFNLVGTNPLFVENALNSLNTNTDPKPTQSSITNHQLQPIGLNIPPPPPMGEFDIFDQLTRQSTVVVHDTPGDQFDILELSRSITATSIPPPPPAEASTETKSQDQNENINSIPDPFDFLFNGDNDNDQVDDDSNDFAL